MRRVRRQAAGVVGRQRARFRPPDDAEAKPRHAARLRLLRGNAPSRRGQDPDSLARGLLRPSIRRLRRRLPVYPSRPCRRAPSPRAAGRRRGVGRPAPAHLARATRPSATARPTTGARRPRLLRPLRLSAPGFYRPSHARRAHTPCPSDAARPTATARPLSAPERSPRRDGSGGTTARSNAGAPGCTTPQARHPGAGVGCGNRRRGAGAERVSWERDAWAGCGSCRGRTQEGRRPVRIGAPRRCRDSKPRGGRMRWMRPVRRRRAGSSVRCSPTPRRFPRRPRSRPRRPPDSARQSRRRRTQRLPSGRP